VVPALGFRHEMADGGVRAEQFEHHTLAEMFAY
jgi:hypothetical protein